MKLYCANDAQCKDLYGVIFGECAGNHYPDQGFC